MDMCMGITGQQASRGAPQKRRPEMGGMDEDMSLLKTFTKIVKVEYIQQ